ncbi:MAG: hypothetical protein ACI4PO_03900 [Faecousia sp.]
MDRLIYKEANGDLTCRSRDFDKVFPALHAYEELGLTPEEIEQQLMNFSSFLSEMTHGHMSKTNYTVEAMVSEANDCFERVFDECADREELVDFKKLGSIDHIRELVQAKKDGRLVVLPCKVGDTVYEICNNTDACKECDSYSTFYGMDNLCDAVDGEERYNPRIADRPICEKQFMEAMELTASIDYIFNHRKDFGKTVFLTRAEAEAAIAEDNNVPAKEEGSE